MTASRALIAACDVIYFCVQLDEIRESYANLDMMLSEVAEEDQRDLLGVRFLPREILADYSIQYLPQLGFLAKLPSSDLTSPAAQLQGFEFKFRTDTHVFYKNGTATELDDSQTIAQHTMGEMQVRAAVGIIESDSGASMPPSLFLLVAQSSAICAASSRMRRAASCAKCKSKLHTSDR